MENLVKDFTPLYTKEQVKKQQDTVQANISNLLTLLNTHRLIKAGGVELYKEKGGNEKIEQIDSLGTDLLDNKELANFIGIKLSGLSEAIFHNGNTLVEVSKTLFNYDPDNEQSAKALEKIWLENDVLIEELINLYSEYIYKVYLDNQYSHNK